MARTKLSQKMLDERNNKKAKLVLDKEEKKQMNRYEFRVHKQNLPSQNTYNLGREYTRMLQVLEGKEYGREWFWSLMTEEQKRLIQDTDEVCMDELVSAPLPGTDVVKNAQIVFVYDSYDGYTSPWIRFETTLSLYDVMKALHDLGPCSTAKKSLRNSDYVEMRKTQCSRFTQDVVEALHFKYPNSLKCGCPELFAPHCKCDVLKTVSGNMTTPVVRNGVFIKYDLSNKKEFRLYEGDDDWLCKTVNKIDVNNVN